MSQLVTEPEPPLALAPDPCCSAQNDCSPRSRLNGLSVGVLANPASIDHDFHHVVDRLAASPDCTLAAIFGPQHGFRSDLQDNMIETPHTKDPRRNVPIFSLYSETREPTPEMLVADRRAGHRPPGRRRAHLHLHLHDGQLPARRGAAGRAGHRLRPAQSDRRRRKSKDRCSSPATSRSSASSACRCGTA